MRLVVWAQHPCNRTCAFLLLLPVVTQQSGGKGPCAWEGKADPAPKAIFPAGITAFSPNEQQLTELPSRSGLRDSHLWDGAITPFPSAVSTTGVTKRWLLFVRSHTLFDDWFLFTSFFIP